MFYIAPSTITGPRGGKQRGFCLEWHGKGYAPLGRAKRSGWYRRKSDAWDALRVANDAVAKLAARPLQEPDSGKGGFVVALTGPQGERHFLCHGPDSPDGQEALHFTTFAAASCAGIAAIHGNPAAFWNSERYSAQEQARRMRGWQFTIIDFCNPIAA